MQQQKMLRCYKNFSIIYGEIGFRQPKQEHYINDQTQILVFRECQIHWIILVYD